MKSRSRTALAWALTALSFVATVAVAFPAAADEPVNARERRLANTHLEYHVRTALVEKLGSRAADLDVGAVSGHVTLGGSTWDRATQELAEEVAKSVDGVRSVNNRIELAQDAGDRDLDDKARKLGDDAEAEGEDQWLETKIKVALIEELDFDAFDVEVEVTEGVVTLRGEVDDEDDRQKALAAARDVSQVKKVIDLLKID